MKSFLFIPVLLCLVHGRILTPQKLFLSPRIYGGEFAKMGQFPYFTLLYVYESEGTFLCGGSVINDNFILTASHCLYGNVSHIEIHFQALDRRNLTSHLKLEVHATSDSFLLHEDYDNEIFGANDIALIYIPDLSKNMPEVKSIRLPSKNDFFMNLEKKDITVIGYGRTGDFAPTSDKLKFVKSTVGEDEECENNYENVYDKTQQICLHTKGIGSICSGDSGGPMIINHNGEDYVVGIASYGRFFCSFGYPACFVRVSNYLEWIEESCEKFERINKI